HKTAALLRGACRMGAICGEADEATVERLTDYGEAVGLMFQVIDDILDVTQTTEHLGKAAGKDEDAGKRTYPGILGLEASREEVDRLSEKALDAIAPFGEAAQPLRDLCEYMAVRTK
ncbi:MAG: polyprenyl synthetase family protein, partial [Phycisphaeraceae bacterium]|nr:polyprenyl synthetase family protein [Phycisphaeraceae bacterium]